MDYLLSIRKFDPHVHCRSPGKQNYKDNMKHVLEVAHRTGHSGAGLMVWNLDPACDNKQVLQECKREMRDAMKDIPIRPALMAGMPDDFNDMLFWLERCEEDNDIAAVCTDISGTTGSKQRTMDYVREVFEAARKTGYDKLIKVHCEAPRYFQEAEMHEEKRPAAAAQMAVHEVITAAENNPGNWTLYLPHLSTAAELAMARTARNQGLKLHAEVTHQAVLCPAEIRKNWPKAIGPSKIIGLTSKECECLRNNLCNQNPPLRTRAEQLALMQAETEGLTDGRASDHAPHTLHDKLKAVSGNPTLACSPRAHLELVHRAGPERAEELLFSNFVRLLHEPLRSEIQEAAEQRKKGPAIEDCTHEYWYDPFCGALPPLDEMLSGTGR